jgi:hypothetical protein
MLPAFPDAHRRRRHGALAAWALALAVVVGGAVYASGSAPPEQEDPAVRQVVESQLRAFAAEDAGKAFALTDPALRVKFGNADAFLATVREQYPQVLRPASLLFLKPDCEGSIALQKVRLTDADGTNWVLTYLLNRQQDQQWKIAGTLIEQEGAQVIA